MKKSTPTATTLAALLSSQAQKRGDDRVYTLLTDGEQEARPLSYGELDLEARAIAARLQRECERGDRVLLLIGDARDFIRGFMACQHAGVIAVPAYPPFPIQSARRLATLRAITRDSGASAVLAAGGGPELRGLLEEPAPELAALKWVAADDVPDSEADDFRPVTIRPEDISFLQYTSGSTALPKGVIVTHDSLMWNEEMIRRSFRMTDGDVVLGWLPLFHDMGLGLVLQTLYAGLQAVLMPPLTFIQRPGLWLQAISRYGGSISGGPDFGYALCVRRIPPEEREQLDLSTWRLAFNGAEPIRAATLRSFAETFEPHGFRASSLYPCYGMAEITLFATGVTASGGATELAVDLAALREGRIEPGGEHVLVSSGAPILHRRVEIVDPETCRRVEPGQIGEIWLAGPDVCAGYWERPDATEETFRARLADSGEGPFLRTGDLGAMYDGQLWVTGRLKDLIIVGGANHYPHDIEATVEAAHPRIRRGCSAAFALEREDREEIVVVAELKPAGDGEDDPAALARTVRTAVAAGHGIQVDHVAFAPPHTLPKTSSGKLQRSRARQSFESGEYGESIGVPKLEEVV